MFENECLKIYHGRVESARAVKRDYHQRFASIQERIDNLTSERNLLTKEFVEADVTIEKYQKLYNDLTDGVAYDHQPASESLIRTRMVNHLNSLKRKIKELEDELS